MFFFRELKSELKELEEKFRKAMVANASLDNEKCQLMFQVGNLNNSYLARLRIPLIFQRIRLEPSTIFYF